MIDVVFDDLAVKEALISLQLRCDNLRPALKAIGEDLKESTSKRFESTTAPDGSSWLLNSIFSTLLNKDGDRPLTDSGTLGSTINYQLMGADTVAIGSPMEYAAMMQFGGTKNEFPHLWGDIPARPFLGVSDSDTELIFSAINQALNL